MTTQPDANFEPSPDSADEPEDWAFAPWDPRSSTARLLVSILAGLLIACLVPGNLPARIRGIVGWDTGALIMNGLAWAIILRAKPSETHRRAGTNDPGRKMVWVIALVSSLVSLFAAVTVLPIARNVSGMYSALALAAVALSWVLTHTAYTLRYAHLFYNRVKQRGSGGLEFPGDDEPSDLDFAYFAFTIGMCFQVSDVVIKSGRIRRAVLLHAILSFVYNTTIVALALNLIYGLLT